MSDSDYCKFNSNSEIQRQRAIRRMLSSIPEDSTTNFVQDQEGNDRKMCAGQEAGFSSGRYAKQYSSVTRLSFRKSADTVPLREFATNRSELVSAGTPENLTATLACCEEAAPEGAKPSEVYTCCICNGRLRTAARAIAKRIARSGLCATNRILLKHSSTTITASPLKSVENAVYLGNVGTILAKGVGCLDIAVKKIWQRSQNGRIGVPVSITISDESLMLHSKQTLIEKGEQNDASLEMNFSLRRISYCSASSSFGTVVAWIYRHEAKYKRVVLRCHAACLKTSKKAQDLGEHLHQSRARHLNALMRQHSSDDTRMASLENQKARNEALYRKFVTINNTLG